MTSAWVVAQDLPKQLVVVMLIVLASKHPRWMQELAQAAHKGARGLSSWAKQAFVVLDLMLERYFCVRNVHRSCGTAKI